MQDWYDARLECSFVIDRLHVQSVLRPFTPHDLRRTAATMCGELGLSEAGISLCLDHQANKDENGKPLPAITRKVYNLATRVRVAKKREVLDAWAIELRRVIGGPATGLRLVA